MRAVLASLVLLLFSSGLAGADDLMGREELARASRGAATEPIRLIGLLELGANGVSDELALRLELREVVAPGARLVLHDALGARSQPLPASHYWSGSVEGRPGSRVTLAVHADGEVRGILADGEGFASLRARPGEEELTFLRVAPGAARPTFECATDELPGIETAIASWDPEVGVPSGIETPEAIAHTARVAVETDYEYYQLFGNASAASQYAVDLLAFSSTIYVDEVDTSLEVVSVSLWTSAADPWVQSSTGCALYEFGKYWNDNHGGDVRTIAHFLSGKSNGGGVAWVGVLCSGAFSYDISAAGCPGMPSVSNYGGAYGYTGTIDGDFQPGNPQPIWDTIAVTHEIGHNFSSPHTHCYSGYGGESSHVDQCATSSSAGCYPTGSPKTLPGPGSVTGGAPGAGNGTIMSYCHLLSGGYSNITLTMGQDHSFGVLPGRVPQRMAAHVASRASAYPTCLAPVDPATIFADDFETGGFGRWSSF